MKSLIEPPWVPLHWPPPLIKSLVPGRFVFSKIRPFTGPVSYTHLDVYKGQGNYIEIFMGQNTTVPIELYVPEKSLEDAKNIIIPVDLDDCEPIE